MFRQLYKCTALLFLGLHVSGCAGSTKQITELNREIAELKSANRELVGKLDRVLLRERYQDYFAGDNAE